MGLDITFKETKPILCPHCGQKVDDEIIMREDSCGNGWFPLLESLNYYIPYDLRTEDNNWYGKDMYLTYEQMDEVYLFINRHLDLYKAYPILGLISRAKLMKHKVIVNADW